MKRTDISNAPVLGIDTSSAHGALGLLVDERPVAEASIPVGRTFSEKLLPSIDRLLRSRGISPEDLALVAVVQGPGSFTGLRIGLATAKGLAYTKGIPVVGLVSLEVLAWESARAGEPVVSVLPARAGWVYTATYLRNADSLECLCPPALRSLDHWVEEPGPARVAVGEGALRHRAMLGEVLPELRVDPEPDRHRPKGESVARLGRRHFLNSGGQTADSLSPLYLQPSLAELRGCAGPPPTVGTGGSRKKSDEV